MVVPPVDDAQHELTASQLQSDFGLPTARAWLAWAETSGLIVRGVRRITGFSSDPITRSPHLG
jgi:hypothetical protein